MNGSSNMMGDTPTTRRVILRWMWGGGLVLLGGGAALLGGREQTLVRESFHTMGTRATILLASASREQGEEAIAAAFREIREVDMRMSRFRAGSDIGRLNFASGAWRAVNPHTAEVLEASLRVFRASDGYFDPCLERLVSRWGFHDRVYPAYPPGQAPPAFPSRKFGGSLQGRPASGESREYRLTNRETGVDLGGIAKGHAIDRAIERLREKGIVQALVNVGDDLRALGGHPQGGPWKIGVRHPRRPGELLEIIDLQEGALATSGDYENYFIRDGRRYPHLLDPHTGLPADYHQSLTVKAPTAMEADALASAGFAAPITRSTRLLQRLVEGRWFSVDREGRLRRG